MRRACELASRGVGNTAPNPPVGAVLVRDGEIIGEGYHHRRGQAHAEVEALLDARRAGLETAGATMFVTLEPCDRTGLTGPCTEALLEARVGRVVIGTLDPTPASGGSGIARLQAQGVDTEVLDDAWAQALIDGFATAVRASRPLVTLKMASSLDGYVAPSVGEQYWLTGQRAREFVRELRIDHDAVMVGAGTVIADDPQLTVRPPHLRLRPYRRVIVAGRRPLDPKSRIFAMPQDGSVYEPTIVFEPEAPLQERVDLGEALTALGARGFTSVLCEGGPTLATSLLAANLVDRIVWLGAPVFLESAGALPALLSPRRELEAHWIFERISQLGDDVAVELRRVKD